MVCTFQKSCHLLKLSKMLLGNIYNWLLVQGNGAITRVLAGLENSTRPLVFTSASGCRASGKFDISSEN